MEFQRHKERRNTHVEFTIASVLSTDFNRRNVEILDLIWKEEDTLSLGRTNDIISICLSENSTYSVSIYLHQ